MTAKSFKDYFSADSKNYHTSRPTYPDSLFEFLSNLCSEHCLAWDCATGNGQAAQQLAKHFEQVLATDASEQQISQAPQIDNVTFSVAPAESTHIEKQSIDLISVAQALHWFDIAAFAMECDRVLKDKGIIAVWCYKRLSINPEVDAILNDFYFNTIGEYWPKERQLVDNGYADIELPFKELPSASFKMQALWSFEQLINYLHTWSAVGEYQKLHHHNPVEKIKNQLLQAWGQKDKQYLIEWPLMLRVFQKNAES